MEVGTFKIDFRSLIKSPSFILRVVSFIFSIIVIACIDRDGYFAGHCLFYSGGSACSFALAASSIAFIYCLIFMVVDAIFLSIQQNVQRIIAMADLGFTVLWTFILFVLFCYMANHWQFSDAKPEELNLVNWNNIRASIAFVFFSIFSWGGMAYVAYRRYTSIRSYNQYADDISGPPRGTEAEGGYIDYFNQPPTPVQTGFNASATADDEFIAGGGHRDGDTELLTP